MHRLLWVVVLSFAWGCNQAPSPVEAEPKLSVADFALQPEREPSDIRMAHEASKENDRKFGESIKTPLHVADMPYGEEYEGEYEEGESLCLPFAEATREDNIDLSDKSVPLEKKLDTLLQRLKRRQEDLFAEVWYDLPQSLTQEQGNKLSADIIAAAQTRKNAWKEAEAVWSAQPQEFLFGVRTLAPASLWNKRWVLTCANKIYQTIDENFRFQDEINQENKSFKPLLEPEPFLKKIELKMAQKEDWKKAQKAEWDKWVQEAPVQERNQAFESIVKNMIDASDWESSWRERSDGSAFRSSGQEGESCLSEDVKTLEKIEFLQQLVSSLPKPWKQTENSFTVCEEASGEECVKGAKSVSWRKVKDDIFSRYEMTTVSCQKGFFENGDCRLGYNRVTDGAGPRTNVSCDTYFNGKCYGEFNSSDIATDVLCFPQPAAAVRIKKSDFDGSWGYFQSSVGCGDEEYDIWCYRFDPETLVCRDGFYQELGECNMDYSVVYGTYLEGCLPDKDLLSCEIKDGLCVNEKIIKGRSHGNKKGNLWTVLDAEKGNLSDSEKKKEFRLTLPKEYAFE